MNYPIVRITKAEMDTLRHVHPCALFSAIRRISTERGLIYHGKPNRYTVLNFRSWWNEDGDFLQQNYEVAYTSSDMHP
jgi:hypothetical protein